MSVGDSIAQGRPLRSVPTLAVKPQPESTVVIDCKDEGWDNVLYEKMWEAAPIELRTLHSSYESYMKQLAEMTSREFIFYPAENRGAFTGRSRK